MKLTVNALVFLIALLGLFVLTVVKIVSVMNGEEGNAWTSAPAKIAAHCEQKGQGFICLPGGKNVTLPELLAALQMPGRVQCVTRAEGNTWQITQTTYERDE